MEMVNLVDLVPSRDKPVPRDVTVDPGDVGRELGAGLGATEAPVQMLAAIVRAYVVALLKKPDARTAEDRSRIASRLRAVLDDAILDGFRGARPPDGFTPPPEKARPHP